MWFDTMPAGSRFLLAIAVMNLFLAGHMAVCWPPLSCEGHTANRLMSRHLPIDEAHLASEPIQIVGDEDFEKLGFPGSGTRDDPYRIENLLILSNQTCIAIRDTRSWFEIVNCTLTSSTKGRSGVHLTNVSHATITECHVTNMREGVYLLHSSNCTVLDCRLLGNARRGIAMETNTNITVSGNQIHDGDGDGIFISGRNRESKVSHNTLCRNNWHGVYLEAARDVEVSSNVVMDSMFGILLERSQNITFRDNELRRHSLGGLLFESSGHNVASGNRFYGCGLGVHGHPVQNWALEVTNNTVEERPLGFLHNVTDTILDVSEYGQIIVVESRDIVLKNALIHDTDHGIRLGYCDNVTVTDCEVFDCSRDGVISQYSSNCTFFNNLVHRTLRVAIYLFQSSGCSVHENIIRRNLDGVYLSATDNSTLSGNEIVLNERYGIRLGFGSDSNLVFNNRLGWNNLSNGYDDSENNAWDNGAVGNAWSDYAGGDVYQIPGPSNSIDRFPRRYVTNTTQTTNGGNLDGLVFLSFSAVVVSIIGVVMLFAFKKRYG